MSGIDRLAVLRPGDRVEKLLDRAVIDLAEQQRANERADLARAVGATVIDQLTQMMLEVGYLVPKKGG